MSREPELEKINPKMLGLISTCLLPPKDIQTVVTGIAIIANLMMNEIQPKLDADSISWVEMNEYHTGFKELLADCAKAQASGILENRHVKQIINDCWHYPYIGYDLIQYCQETKILDEADGYELLKLVKQAIIDNPKAVTELLSGKEKAIGALVGSVMKKQKANPVEIQSLIKTELGI
jgi:Asp-tRNA(Asn)/Glu-tRNA(Gln) amidotransferase B subunit